MYVSRVHVCVHVFIHVYVFTCFCGCVGKFPLDGEKSLSDVRNMIHKLYSSLNVGQLQVCANVSVCGTGGLSIQYNVIICCKV